jgi:outer membrane immunogenic protein
MMNLKTFAAALLIGASSTAAMAADLPSRKVAPAPAYAAPIFTWSGFYLGLQAGYAWDKVSFGTGYNYLGLPGAPVAPFTGFGYANANRGGFVGGGHVGYLYQTGPAVFGVEGDVEGTTISGSGLRASLRGRLGFALDRVLFYGTGGLAVAGGNGGYNNGWNTFGYGNNGGSTNLGWTAGAGVEYAFAQNWSARLEYRYSDFGSRNIGYFASTSVRRTENAVRLGVSYHFSAPVAAVVAKY